MGWIQWTWVDLVQLLLAAALGGAVGYVRELRGKPAGTPTMTLVTICATLLMQLSFKLSAGMGSGNPGDPARLAAAVITGIGFLGAGAIIRRGGHVDGLTSAATIWVMSAVGLAIGASYYVPAGITVLMILTAFWVNPAIERFIVNRRKRLGIEIPASIEEDGDSEPF
jgi:putative Mg2+ transporter-C (MgtC) family protein